MIQIWFALLVPFAFAAKPEPTAFEKALGGWKDSNLRVCHIERQRYFVSTEEQEDTCRGRGGYVAYATAEERASVSSTDSGVPSERDAIGEYMIRKELPLENQRNFDPLAR